MPWLWGLTGLDVNVVSQSAGPGETIKRWVLDGITTEAGLGSRVQNMIPLATPSVVKLRRPVAVEGS